MLALVSGLLVGALVAGAGGYFLGANSDSKVGTAPSRATSATLRPYEAKLAAQNKPKFESDLAAVAAPWLPSLSSCVATTDPNGPKLLPDENQHVLCRYGGLFVHFAQYKSKQEKETSRAYREQLALDASRHLAGSKAPASVSGAVSNKSGRYVEYAFGNAGEPPLCGLWWDGTDSTTAFYVEAPCQVGLGGNWDTLRDLWQRFS